MNNQQIAEVFQNIADLLEIQGGNRFQVLAYRRAAENILSFSRPLRAVYQSGELEQIPGVGEAIAQKIAELLESGHLKYYDDLMQEVPAGVLELLRVPDVGPVTARRLWKELGITSTEALKAAAEAGNIRKLKGFGAKTEKKILAGLAALERRSDRTPIGVARQVAEALMEELLSSVKSGVIAQHALAGSLRRWRETIGDLDLLVASGDPETVMEAYRKLPQVDEVLLSGLTKTSVRLADGLQADLRVLPPECWGTALQYFTGSQNHNVAIRELAQQRGWRLNEYAIVADGEERLFDSEEAVYEALGLPWIPPELREDRGEVEAAQRGALPTLIEVDNLRGELHAHSTWSDGTATIAEMAEAARSRGYEYFLISDHSAGLGVVRGVNAARLRAQAEEIARLNRQWSDFRLLHGVEVEVKADGSLDLLDEVLAELDVVVASVHTGLRRSAEEVTKRALSAIRNPHVDILAHPTGRLLGRREGGAFDMDALMKAAAETGTILEINANPQRLDLSAEHARRAVELGCLLAISCDAHKPDELAYIRYGVATARRGWVTAEHVVNTKPLSELLSIVQRHRKEGG